MSGRRRGPYPSTCPDCGAAGEVMQLWAIGNRCRACIRAANGWTCRECGSADPHHPHPCPTPHNESSD